MEYRVIALGQEIADAVRTTLKAPGYGHPAHVETASGTGPCRVCLRPFRTGEEERVLFTYNPFPDTADLPGPGPVFVHRVPCERFIASGFPPELASLPLTLDAYDEHGALLQRVKVADPDADTRMILGRSGVAYAHLRHSVAGCFIARIERQGRPTP